MGTGPNCWEVRPVPVQPLSRATLGPSRATLTASLLSLPPPPWDLFFVCVCVVVFVCLQWGECIAAKRHMRTLPRHALISVILLAFFTHPIRLTMKVSLTLEPLLEKVD